MKISIDQLQFNQDGLIPVVVQDAQTKAVLTLAYMNKESLARTLTEGETWFWSRSRQELWHKGATSGHTQRVVDVRQDCDADALVVLVEPRGPACHSGAISCFDRANDGDNRDSDLGAVLRDLYSIIETRRRELPEGSYTTYLFTQGLDKILKKVGEESAETIIAAKNGDARALAAETSDLIYHLLVLLVERGVSLEEISRELIGRRVRDGKK
ncbi:MAG: bifunctional phosphoribosyl-AMP cyclohydrolase/phosphoribosyl-ATP diphosphatase HisIE [Pyrinomonadaceae bacterium]